LIAGESKSSIIIRFSTILHKEWFLRRYYINIKNMSLKKLGIVVASDQRFFINQNLFNIQYLTLKCAKHYKKLKAISKFRINNFGMIYVKLDVDSDFLLMKDASELKT
jgi:hypothetical protein